MRALCIAGWMMPSILRGRYLMLMSVLIRMPSLEAVDAAGFGVLGVLVLIGVRSNRDRVALDGRLLGGLVGQGLLLGLLLLHDLPDGRIHLGVVGFFLLIGLGLPLELDALLEDIGQQLILTPVGTPCRHELVELLDV